MKALKLNDFPNIDAGVQALWNFSGEITRRAYKHDMDEFFRRAHQDAMARPASFYGMALEGKSWEIETSLNRIGGDQGYLATQILKTTAHDGRIRRWQFLLRKN